MLFQLPLEVIIMLVPVLLFSLTVHEFSHALAAYALGDQTAYRAGRLTLNPAAHLDLFGTIMLLLVGFGYAKPVPVNPGNFKHPRRDDTFVALAGPGANLLMAVIFGLALRFSIPFLEDLARQPGADLKLLRSIVSMGNMVVWINLVLAVFNVLPIYPLDGSHVMENSLPYDKAMKFRESARYSMLLFLVILFFEPVRAVIFAPAVYLARVLVGG